METGWLTTRSSTPWWPARRAIDYFWLFALLSLVSSIHIMLTWITPRYNLDRCFQWFSSSLLQPIKLIIFTQQPLKTAHVCPVFLLWLSRDKYLLCRYCLPTDQPSELIDGNLSHSVCKLLKPEQKEKHFFHVKILLNIVRGCQRGQEKKYHVEKHFLISHIKCSLCNGIVFPPACPWE